MKFDVVICYYKNEWAWERVFHGLLANAESIGTVLVVNDDRWENGETDRILKTANGRLPVHLLYHEHNGFGAHRSINQGVRAARTEYVVTLDGDVVLAPGSLAKNAPILDPETMVLGLAHDVSKDITLADLSRPEGPPIERVDFRLNRKYEKSIKFLEVRDLYILVNRQSYWDVGGHDEVYPGYGFHDYDYGIRWMDKFGLDSITLGPGEAYHLGGATPGHLWDPENKFIFDHRMRAWQERNNFPYRAALA